ncbi:predicted protein [Histoplasma capsulatum H143]|uniref:Uncharacterized protein n=1 Tax=Ajellomyces capsulatus (strain H143) TaxID=544712 RepID=C6HB24_AJECH|nr:predicted protein [Histoplasma capsulatum H143]
MAVGQRGQTIGARLQDKEETKDRIPIMNGYSCNAVAQEEKLRWKRSGAHTERDRKREKESYEKRQHNQEDVLCCWLRGEGSIIQLLSWRGGGLEKPWSLLSSRGEGVEPVVDRASNPPGSRPAERLALADSPIRSTQYAGSTASHSYSTDSTFFCSPVCGQTFSPRKLFVNYS